MINEIRPIFKKPSFGSEGILPVAYLNFDIKNPTDFSQKIDNILVTIPTPNGTLKGELKNGLTIEPNKTTPFSIVIRPSIDLISALVYLTKNWKKGGFVMNIEVTTPEGVFPSQQKLN